MAGPLIIIAGPTASGKSKVGLYLAGQLKGEIVSLDSAQVYRELDIGTAKPSSAELKLVRHHLLDVCAAHEEFNVAKYLALAHAALEDIATRAHQPIFVGGSTLYLTSLLHGLASLPPQDPALRAELAALSGEELHALLGERDSVSAARIHRNDKVRLVRALEAVMLGSEKASAITADHNYREAPRKGLIIVPVWKRAELYARINKRTQEMLSAGLVEEVRQLSARYGPAAASMRCLGYAQVLHCLQGSAPLDELEEQIAMFTRRYAKRQITFFRNEPGKRGWQRSPALGQGEDIGADFTVLRFDSAQLMQAVKERLNSPFNANEIWFIDASRFFNDLACTA